MYSDLQESADTPASTTWPNLSLSESSAGCLVRRLLNRLNKKVAEGPEIALICISKPLRFMPTNRFLPRDKAAELLQVIHTSEISTEYDRDRHRLTILDGAGMAQAQFRLPIPVPYAEAGTGIAEAGQVHYVMLLIQAGNCAMGYFENGRCLNHKVFRSYMVRKKQGKSQIKYLKTKGKSRAGSRVRLGETAEFFENINSRLQEYFQQHRIDRIAISCSKTLLPYLYTSAVPTPFDKRDQRLFKIPKHIHTPIYEVLLDANRFLQRGELIPLTEAGFEAVPVLRDFLQHHADDSMTEEAEDTADALVDEVYITDDWEEDEMSADELYFEEDEEDDDIIEWD
ncbi:hypothetical protein O71_06067 [Pontibacter sp. BAB1700]|uniref:VLRF1 domain-containing protein n=2 Tax=Hymenobacteraceae TaxID=1853232 RepID=A0A1N6VZT6_9BACT|nr:hypothetical protein O71_06067 [Pontibacter sp. BAB1700]SIQ83334.1 hypothetical protein SAMN05421545_1290 [Pontibacter lucknowensis]